MKLSGITKRQNVHESNFCEKFRWNILKFWTGNPSYSDTQTIEILNKFHFQFYLFSIKLNWRALF